MRIAACMLASYCFCSLASAEIVTKSIDYKHGGTELRGYLAYDDAVKGKRPGVLLVHEWWGLNDYAKQRARQLAEQGFVAFALDMYGKDVLAEDRAEAAKMSSEYKGKPIIRERAKAGYDVLAKQELVDGNKIAAIGYCFGGTTVLELAYSGTDLVGVVSFHGGLVAPKPGDKFKAKILALHGADDPFVPGDLVNEFERGMRESGADWQLIVYGDAIHTFTNPKAGSDKSTGSAYNERADKRSWKHMKEFFEEIFAEKK